MKIIERTFDATTGETTDIEREATAEEIATREALIAEAQAKAEAEATKAAAKQVVLDRLGITAEEATLLLG
jgi:hypothetical protein